MNTQQARPSGITRNVVRIVLIGFMGAGKSTVGLILAEKLAWPFVDTDHHLESESGATVATLFNDLGEPAFRRIEADAIAQLLQQRELVLSLGGGAIETESTRALLQKNPETCVVFLDAPLDVLIDRCESQPGAAIRPVLNQREALSQRFHSRLPHYHSAHLTVSTEGLAAGSVAEEILELMFHASFSVSLKSSLPEKAATI